jgi:alcohol dehydrogenase class IV
MGLFYIWSIPNQEVTMTILLNLPRIHFDFGAVKVLATELTRLSIDRPLVMTDQNLVECGVIKKVEAAIPPDRPFTLFDETPENPTVEGVEKACKIYDREGCDGLVAVGGGSVIDSTKAVALRAGHPGPLSRYDRRPDKVKDAAAPIIAVPTTAGTGSEVTFGAGIHNEPSLPAMNISSPHLIPRVAICDPDFSMTLPVSLTAGTGMDALGQCIEAYLAKGRNPLIDLVALDGAQRAWTHIERAVADGSDKKARWNMQMAALQGGIGIHKGLGSVHAITNTFGDQGYNHGILVAITLPGVLRFLEGHVEKRMTALAKILGLEKGAQIANAVQQLNKRIGLPANLKELGYVMADIDRAAKLCVESVFNRSSVRIPTHGEYKVIITEVMG